VKGFAVIFIRNGVVAALSSIVVLASCRRDSEPNPCQALKPTSAAFRMEEKVGYQDQARRFEVDTIAADRSTPIFFTAEDSLATYEWKVGQDPTIHRERSFYLTFEQAYGRVPVQLIVRKPPNKGCFPQDDGVDTLVRDLYVVPLEQAPIVGEYEGYNVSDPSRRFTISITQEGLSNLPGGCFYRISQEIAIGSTALQVYSSIIDLECGLGGVSGWGVLQKNRREIVFDYAYTNSNLPTSGSQRVKNTFKGVRK